MDLKSKTKAELKEMAKELVIEGYEEMNKVTLLTTVTEKLKEQGIEVTEDTPEPEPVKEQPKEEVKKIKPAPKSKIKELTQQARNWKAYLERYQITPEAFLSRYPNHPYKQFIQELIN